MPPRYAYWTILVDEQPTAFRAGSQEDLMPTFKRLKEKNPSAKMMWWQNGKLWASRLDAQEAMRARGEMGRAKDFRQRDDARPVGRRSFGEGGGGFRARDRQPRQDFESDRREPSGKLEWKPKGEGAPPRDRKPLFEKPEWKPKGEGSARFQRPEWKPKGEGSARLQRPEWKPKGENSARPQRPEWKPKGEGSARPQRPDWKPKGDRPVRQPFREGGRSQDKLEWKPKGAGTGTSSRSGTHDSGAPKRKWIPKEEYKKSQGIEARRDKNWRPGGAHKDPRQKYKDAKKAKWTRFKQNIRQRSGAKPGGPRKRRDDE